MEHLQIKNEVIRILENRIQSATSIPVDIGLASSNYKEWLDECKASTPLQIEDATHIYLSRLNNTGKLPFGFGEIRKYTVGPYSFECDGLSAPSLLRSVKSKFGNGKQPKQSTAVPRSGHARNLQIKVIGWRDEYHRLDYRRDKLEAQYKRAKPGDLLYDCWGFISKKPVGEQIVKELSEVA